MMRVGQQPLKRAFAVDDEGEASTTAQRPVARCRRSRSSSARRAPPTARRGAASTARSRRRASRASRAWDFARRMGTHGDRGHRAQRPARPAGQPADARHEGRGVDRRRARLEARAAHVRRHPFPRRRPARLRLGRRFQLHRAEGHEERRLRHAAALRAASRRHPLLRAPADRQAARPRSATSPRPSPIRSTPISRAACSTSRSASASPSGRPRPTIPTTTRTTGCRPTTSTATARASPTPRICGRC